MKLRRLALALPVLVLVTSCHAAAPRDAFATDASRPTAAPASVPVTPAPIVAPAPAASLPSRAHRSPVPGEARTPAPARVTVAPAPPVIVSPAPRPFSAPGVYCPVPGEPGMPSDDPACQTP